MLPRKREIEMFQRSTGFTLIELMITVVIVAIGVSLAVPSWNNLVQKRRTTGGAEEIAAFLASAQSEAVKRNELVTVTIQRNGAGTDWCVGAINETQMDIVVETHCHCNQDDPARDKYCEFDDGQPRRITQDGFEKFAMDLAAVAGIANDHFFFSFDPVRGIKLAENGAVVNEVNSVTIMSDNTHYKLQVDISVTGRVRVCNPDSSKKVPGFVDCGIGPIVLPPPIPL